MLEKPNLMRLKNNPLYAERSTGFLSETTSDRKAAGAGLVRILIAETAAGV